MMTSRSRRSFLLLATGAAVAGCRSRPPDVSAARDLDALLATLDTTALVVMHEGRVIHRYGGDAKLSYLASARCMSIPRRCRPGRFSLTTIMGIS